MATTDLNYHSYFCIFTKTQTDSTCTNPFKTAENADNGWVEGTNYEILSSPDYEFDPSTGKIRLKAPGNYFVIVNLSVEGQDLGGTSHNIKVHMPKDGQAANASSTLVTGDVKQYGLLTGAPVDWVGAFITGGIDTTSQGGELVREDETSEYFIEIAADNDPAAKFNAGSSITIVKANGSFASKSYATSTNAQTDEDYDLFDTDEGGTFQVNVSDGVTINDDGQFSPDATRKFLMLSTFYATTNTNIEIRHRLKIGSGNDEVIDYELHTSGDPSCNTICYAKEIADSTFVRVNNGVADSSNPSISVDAPTSLTLFDISNKGTDPGAYLSFTTTKDTDTFSDSSGDMNIFDQANYGSATITKDDNLTASNITYAADGGTFTVALEGIYLVMLTLRVDSTDAILGTDPHDCDFNITSGGSTSTYYTRQIGPHEGAENLTPLASALVPLQAGDALTFTVHDLEGHLEGDSNGGSSITIIKVDEVGGSRDIFPKETASTQIGDDYTLNTLSRDVLGNQHDDLVNKRVPVSTAQPGPRHLRGRLTSYNVTSGGKK